MAASPNGACGVWLEERGWVKRGRKGEGGKGGKVRANPASPTLLFNPSLQPCLTDPALPTLPYRPCLTDPASPVSTKLDVGDEGAADGW